MERKYYIMDCASCTIEHKEECLEICIGNADTQRYSLSGNKLLIKTNTTMTCDCCVEHTIDKDNKELPQLRPVLASPEWSHPDLML